MAIEDYRIPWHPLDIATPLNAIRQRYRDRDADARADEELRLKSDKIKNDERRLSAEEFRRTREFSQGQEDRRNKALLSALEFEKKGDHSTADAIRRAHGIETIREMGPPKMYTPAMALAASSAEEGSRQAAMRPTGDAVKFEPSAPEAPSMATPMNALARPQSGTGVSVPEPMRETGYQGGGMEGPGSFGESQRQVAADNLSTVGTGLQGEQRQAPLVKIDEPFVIDDSPDANPTGVLPSPESPAMMEPDFMAGTPDRPAQPAEQIGHGQAGHAIEDLMGIMQDPIPTGALRFNGPGGVLLGRYDPAEERKFREDKASKIASTLGPLGEHYVRIASAVARGEIPEAEGKILISTIAAEATARQKEAGKDRRQEDQQLHQALLAKLYRNEALTRDDIFALARIKASVSIASAGGGPVTPQEAELVRLIEGGATGGEVATRAAEMGPKADLKHVLPLTQNVVKNAATAERAGEKRAGLEVNDWNGNALGTAHNVTQANVMKKQTDQFAQARVRLIELIEDIKKDGSRVLSPREIQDRLSKAESVNAAMRVYNGLGATDASQQLEARITGAIGTPGHGFLMGANVGVIERILHEAEGQHSTRIKTTLRSGGGRPLAPALGGPRQGGSTSARASYSGPRGPARPDRQGPNGEIYRWNGTGYEEVAQ